MNPPVAPCNGRADGPVQDRSARQSVRLTVRRPDGRGTGCDSCAVRRCWLPGFQTGSPVPGGLFRCHVPRQVCRQSQLSGWYSLADWHPFLLPGPLRLSVATVARVPGSQTGRDSRGLSVPPSAVRASPAQFRDWLGSETRDRAGVCFPVARHGPGLSHRGDSPDTRAPWRRT